MSTVDAAIIDFVVNNPGSGSGTKYTAGNAIDLTSNKISVKYDPATMQLVDGKISALPQSGGTGVALSAGDAINIADNKINVKYNTGTMELVNGALSAKTSSSGTTYTAGNAIDLTSNKISVKYDTNTMELKDGKLAAKTGLSTDKSSLGFDKNGYLLYDGVAKENVSFRMCAEDTENGDILMMSHYNKTDKYKLTTLNVTDAARFYVDSTDGVQNTNSLQFFKDGTIEAMNDAKKITIKASTVDIQGTLLHNGLAAGSSEDVMYQNPGVRIEHLIDGVQIAGINSLDLKTGNVIRLLNSDGTEFKCFIIRRTPMDEDAYDNTKFLLIDSAGNMKQNAVLINDGYNGFALKIFGKSFAEEQPIESGLYIMQKMSTDTMCKLIMNQFSVFF